MNRQKIILVVLGALVLTAGATMVFLNSGKEKVAEDTSIVDTLKSNINENVTFTEVEKTEEFETLEEMMEFAEKNNSISTEEEGIQFINDFLLKSSENRPELIIGSYQPYIRDAVIERQAFPIYDDTGLFDYDVSSIDITSTNENLTEYVANYRVTMISKSENVALVQFDSTDTFELTKENGKIYIKAYSRKISNQKELLQ